MERPTFSQSWSRVSHLTPTLRPHVQITRQLFRGDPWHVVHDPISNNFFRLNPVAYHFVGLLDGKRAVDDAWQLTTQRYADAAPTQNEVISLLGQLNQSNLLRVDLPADAQQLLQRSRQRRIKHWTGQAMSILFLRIPIFNPNRILTWTLPLVRPLVSPLGLGLWVIWMAYCLYRFLPELGVFFNSADSVLAPSNWGWMALLFTLIKAWHEFGHGIVCKRLGGVVPEFGVMMLVLFPAPYVDATASWSFTDKWKRLIVAAAGMIFELPVAGAAALVWIHETHNNPGSLTQQLAYNAVFLASITTILFNANPLLRFDGYYMLSDLLEVPNLYDRSSKHLKWLVQRWAFGMENAQPVSTLPGEQGILLAYGIGSQIYRVLVLTGIILFIAGKLLALGVLMAVWSLIAWLVVPVAKFFHWLATSPQLHEKRRRAMLVTAGFIVIVGGGLGVWPVPEHRRAEGIVESAKAGEVVMQSDGFVTKVLVDAGQHVEQGQALIEAENPVMDAHRAELVAQLNQMQLARRKALPTDPVAMRAAEAKAQSIAEELQDIDRRLSDLVLRSPQSGTLIGDPMQQLQGRFIKRGQVIAKVADLTDVRVTALVSQSQSADAFFSKIQKVELRSVSRRQVAMASHLIKAFDSGRTELPHPALGTSGGGTIAMDPSDPKGHRVLRPQFELWLHWPDTAADKDIPALLGQRVYVRFTLPPRPLLDQWLRRIRMVIRDRLSI
ncbi:MAG: PqqD family peptide modification chaperone [Phycisphaeraceae bacterium]|nr:PqqD family peptide modification chaperone [Phycisphaeraceae bacterium]